MCMLQKFNQFINERYRNPKGAINNGPSSETDNNEDTRHKAQTNKKQQTPSAPEYLTHLQQ